jgi:hypothetical protein
VRFCTITKEHSIMRDRIGSVPAGTFGSPNIMTNKVEAYYKIKGGYVELSSGRGLRGNGLWGVSVRPRSAGQSQCFDSEVAALGYIEELSA